MGKKSIRIYTKVKRREKRANKVIEGAPGGNRSMGFIGIIGGPI
jgi:hypothetical protein